MEDARAQSTYSLLHQGLSGKRAQSRTGTGKPDEQAKHVACHVCKHHGSRLGLSLGHHRIFKINTDHIRA